MASTRKRQQRARRAEKKSRRQDKPGGKSRYALKKVQQSQGRFSLRSPIVAGPAHEEERTA